MPIELCMQYHWSRPCSKGCGLRCSWRTLLNCTLIWLGELNAVLGRIGFRDSRVFPKWTGAHRPVLVLPLSISTSASIREYPIRIPYQNNQPATFHNSNLVYVFYCHIWILNLYKASHIKHTDQKAPVYIVCSISILS